MIHKGDDDDDDDDDDYYDDEVMIRVTYFNMYSWLCDVMIKVIIMMLTIIQIMMITMTSMMMMVTYTFDCKII